MLGLSASWMLPALPEGRPDLRPYLCLYGALCRRVFTQGRAMGRSTCTQAATRLVRLICHPHFFLLPDRSP